MTGSSLPGGAESVILTVDTQRVLGGFEKKARVWSNDPERKSIVRINHPEKPDLPVIINRQLTESQ